MDFPYYEVFGTGTGGVLSITFRINPDGITLDNSTVVKTIHDYVAAVPGIDDVSDFMYAINQTDVQLPPD